LTCDFWAVFGGVSVTLFLREFRNGKRGGCGGHGGARTGTANAESAKDAKVRKGARGLLEEEGVGRAFVELRAVLATSAGGVLSRMEDRGSQERGRASLDSPEPGVGWLRAA